MTRFFITMITIKICFFKPLNLLEKFKITRTFLTKTSVKLNCKNKKKKRNINSNWEHSLLGAMGSMIGAQDLEIWILEARKPLLSKRSQSYFLILVGSICREWKTWMKSVPKFLKLLKVRKLMKVIGYWNNWKVRNSKLSILIQN